MIYLVVCCATQWLVLKLKLKLYLHLHKNPSKKLFFSFHFILFCLILNFCLAAIYSIVICVFVLLCINLLYFFFDHLLLGYFDVIYLLHNHTYLKFCTQKSHKYMVPATSYAKLYNNMTRDINNQLLSELQYKSMKPPYVCVYI